MAETVGSNGRKAKKLKAMIDKALNVTDTKVWHEKIGQQIEMQGCEGRWFFESQEAEEREPMGLNFDEAVEIIEVVLKRVGKRW